MLSDDDYEFPDDDVNYSDDGFEKQSPKPKAQSKAQGLATKKESLDQSGFDELPLDDSYAEDKHANLHEEEKKNSVMTMPGTHADSNLAGGSYPPQIQREITDGSQDIFARGDSDVARKIVKDDDDDYSIDDQEVELDQNFEEEEVPEETLSEEQD